MKDKYRIVEVKTEGYDPYYRIEEKVLWWWFDIAIVFSKEKALQVLREKRTPPKITEKVLDE